MQRNFGRHSNSTPKLKKFLTKFGMKSNAVLNIGGRIMYGNGLMETTFNLPLEAMGTMLDEPAEYGADARDFDPIDPSLGHYYLYDELRKRTHVSVFGESEFASWERARFVRSCSTMWPFLRIRRVWLGIGFKEQAQSKVMERRKIENVLFEGGIRL